MDNCLLESSCLEQLQEALGVLIGLHVRFRLRTNKGGMVGMTCQPYCMDFQHSEAAYSLWMTGVGLSYQA